MAKRAEIKKEKAPSTPELLLLRMEISACRDRMVQDLAGILGRIDAAIPEEDAPRRAGMRTWNSKRWREFLDTGK
jgi:hypothetical protein